MIEINEDIYIKIMEGVEKNLIECTVLLPWQIDQSPDLIFDEIHPYF